MPRMCASASWLTSRRGWGAPHLVLRGSSFALGAAAAAALRHRGRYLPARRAARLKLIEALVYE